MRTVGGAGYKQETGTDIKQMLLASEEGKEKFYNNNWALVTPLGQVQVNSRRNTKHRLETLNVKANFNKFKPL